MADGKQRISIGFHGRTARSRASPPTSSPRCARRSTRARGWHEIEAEDGTIAAGPRKVVFVRVEAGDQRVGFGA